MNRNLSTNRLKILAFFIHRYRWGEQIRGDERGFLEKAKQFRKLGITVYTIETEHSIQEHMKESVYTSVKIPVKIEAPKGPIKLMVTLVKLILTTLLTSTKVHYDVIYAYNQDMVNVIPAYLLKLISKKPLVIVFHLLRRKEMIPFREAVIFRLKKGFNPSSAFFASILEIVLRFVYKRADFYITTNQAIKNDLSRYLKIPKVLVAGNGVDTDKFRPHDLRKIYDAAFLGRLHPQKGITTLLKAWKMIVEKNKSSKIVLIGGGDKKEAEHIEAMIDSLGIRENVEMAGFVPDKELVGLLNQSKLFVFPSRYDGFALAVAEAMACGLPCIVSNIPALKKNYEKAAILVDPDDVEGFKKAIVELLKDEKRREELGKKAREHVKRFNWKEVAEKEIEAFSSPR